MRIGKVKRKAEESGKIKQELKNGERLKNEAWDSEQNVFRRNLIWFFKTLFILSKFKFLNFKL